MSVSSFITLSKTSAVLYFRLACQTVLALTLQFCREQFVIKSYDLDEYGNILLFLLDCETIVKLNVVHSTREDFSSEISVIGLCGDVDSTSLFAEVFFDLHNFIADLILM